MPQAFTPDGCCVPLTDGNARRQATEERASGATDTEVASSVVDDLMPVTLGTA